MQAICSYITKELKNGSVMGPFQESTFIGPVKISPLSTTEKKDSMDRWVILELSFLEDRSVNSGVPQKEYLVSPIDLRF